MDRSAGRLIQYYTHGHYKGFYPVEGERHYRTIGNEVHLTFTNGQTKIFALGTFPEKALLAMFDLIDDYHKKLSVQVKPQLSSNSRNTF
jgi:hypothetical protein